MLHRFSEKLKYLLVIIEQMCWKRQFKND